MQKDKKQYILDSSIKIFNERGFEALNLHELAALLNMSRGNLAYHYKDKDELLKAIVEQMSEKIEADRASSRQFPSFENLHNEVQLYYKYQKEYAFIFLNSNVMNHPNVIEHFREMTEKTIKANQSTMIYSMRSGNLKPEPIPGLYNNIATTTWMLAFYWLSQQMIRGNMATEDGEKMIWSLLVPHLTEKGLDKFKSYFGEKYLNSLGKPMEFEVIKNEVF